MSGCLSCGKKRAHLDHSRGTCKYAKPPSTFATKPRKRVNPRSKVMRAFYVEERIPLVKAVLIRDGFMCQFPGCTKRADTVHEKLTRGRGGGVRAPGVNTLENCVAVCAYHNGWISEHSDWAEENGWLVKSGGRNIRFAPNTPVPSVAPAPSDVSPVADGAGHP